MRPDNRDNGTSNGKSPKTRKSQYSIVFDSLTISDCRKKKLTKENSLSRTLIETLFPPTWKGGGRVTQHILGNENLNIHQFFLGIILKKLPL